ncbi:hypothetical protein BDR06DRAFT_963304 [Suillus hirtellus]|nr:hypothetical protein BDR06DRAFT_963304 [Suillus hirtellus]
MKPTQYNHTSRRPEKVEQTQSAPTQKISTQYIIKWQPMQTAVNTLLTMCRDNLSVTSTSTLTRKNCDSENV